MLAPLVPLSVTVSAALAKATGLGIAANVTGAVVIVKLVGALPASTPKLSPAMGSGLRLILKPKGWIVANKLLFTFE